MARQAPFLALGNAILDIIAPVEDGFLATHGIEKGGMRLLADADTATRLYDAITPAGETSGGSAANTAVGVVAAGGEAGFIGVVGDDRLGQVFTDDLRASGVAFAPVIRKGARSGSSIILVTPDAERSMNTHLGAAAMLTPDDITAHADTITAAEIVHSEAYVLDMAAGAACLDTLTRIAADGKTRFSVSLSDPGCVHRHLATLRRLVAEHAAFVFANLAEMEALTGARGAVMYAPARALADEVVITNGAEGAVVLAAGKKHEIPARKNIRVVDTTGAGDMFAATYIATRMAGGGIAAAGEAGAGAAAEIITRYGARPGGIDAGGADG